MIMPAKEEEKQDLEKKIVGAVMDAKDQEICSEMEYIRNERDYAFIGAGIGLFVGGLAGYAGYCTETDAISFAWYGTAAVSAVVGVGLTVLGFIKHKKYNNFCEV